MADLRKSVDIVCWCGEIIRGRIIPSSVNKTDFCRMNPVLNVSGVEGWMCIRWYPTLPTFSGEVTV